MTDQQLTDNTKISHRIAIISAATVLFIPICMAVLYFFGKTFYREVLGFWGLRSSLFPIDIGETIYYGAFVLKPFALGPLLVFLLALLLVMLFIPLSFYLANKVDSIIIRWIPEKKVSEKGSNVNKRHQERQNVRGKNLASLLLIFTGLFVACIFTIVAALFIAGFDDYIKNLAYQNALNTKNNYDKNLENTEREKEKFNSAQKFHIKGRGELRGIIITCSSSVCALYLGQGKRTIFKVADIESNIAYFIPKKTITEKLE